MLNGLNVVKRLFVGKAAPLGQVGRESVLSGIVKFSKFNAVYLSSYGLDGDEQGDRRFHGGREKALYHYASEHYPALRIALADCPVPLRPGAFGENISTVGMTEHSVCIGDVYRIGHAVVQVSQGRQPGWKLNRPLVRTTMHSRCFLNSAKHEIHTCRIPLQSCPVYRRAVDVPVNVSEHFVSQARPARLGAHQGKGPEKLARSHSTERSKPAWQAYASVLSEPVPVCGKKCMAMHGQYRQGTSRPVVNQARPATPAALVGRARIDLT